MATGNYTLIGSLLTSGLAAAIAVIFISRYHSKKAKRALKQTMHSMVLTSRPDSISHLGKRPEDYDPATAAKSLGSSKGGKSKQADLKSRLFQAGYFFHSDLVRFQKQMVISFLVSVAFAAAIISLPLSALLSLPLRLIIAFTIVFIGYALPLTRLDRKIASRTEEISYHLPLTIEQLAIGVSSGLDIWPCVTNLIVMTVKRRTVTPIIELFMLSDKLIRSGMSVTEALRSVGDDSGHTNLKHAFVFLAQVAEHGGDVSRNLQEMADATMIMRSTEVEAKIHTLPVKATGPLCLVFAGFFGLMLSGLFVQMLNAFPKDQAAQSNYGTSYEEIAEAHANYAHLVSNHLAARSASSARS